MKIRKNVGAFAVAMSFVGVVVTILGFAVPTARDWMLRHAGPGWVLAGVLLTIVLGLAVLLDGSIRRVAEESQAHETELQAALGATKRVEADRDAARQELADELNGTSRIADGELLTERLGPWRQGCSIMDWLKNTMDGDKIPVQFLDQIDRRRTLWANDTRTLARPAVGAAFDQLRTAINVYGAGMSSTMWLLSDRTFMAVPIEWEMTRPTDFETAVDTNGEAGLEMLVAMQNLFSVIHENGVRLGPITPADAED